MRTFGLLQLLLGLLAIAGLLKGDAQLDRIAWTAPGTVFWVAACAWLALAGAGLVAQSWNSRRPPVALVSSVTGAVPALLRLYLWLLGAGLLLQGLVALGFAVRHIHLVVGPLALVLSVWTRWRPAPPLRGDVP